MDEKKSYSADLEHRRWRWFVAGLIASVLLLLAVLMIPLNPTDEWEDPELTEQLLHDIELMPIQHEQQVLIATAPEEPKPSERLKVVDEEVLPEETNEQQPEMALETEADEPEAEEEDKPDEAEQPPTPALPDDIAQFPGGQGALARWLTEHIKYPAKAQQWKQQGQVVVSFTVEADGSLSNVALAKSATALLDREVLRAIGDMPTWQPAKHGGQPCRSTVRIPVIFKL